jgi:hypothetical protein
VLDYPGSNFGVIGVSVNFVPDLQFGIIVELIGARKINGVIDQYFSNDLFFQSRREWLELVQRVDPIGEGIAVLFRVREQTSLFFVLPPLLSSGNSARLAIGNMSPISSWGQSARLVSYSDLPSKRPGHDKASAPETQAPRGKSWPSRSGISSRQAALPDDRT